MHFTTIFTFVAGLALASAAAIAPRQDDRVGVLICKGTQGNDCQDITLGNGECHGMGGGFDDKLSSLKTNPGVACDLFQEGGCFSMMLQGLQGAVGNFGSQANDKTSSMRCYRV